MKLTFHCQKRQRQRGRNDLDIDIIRRYGECSRGVYMLTHRRIGKHASRLRRWLKKHRSPSVQKRAAQVREIVGRLEKLNGWTLVVSPANKAAVTIYLADKHRQRKFMRGGCRPAEGFHNDK